MLHLVRRVVSHCTAKLPSVSSIASPYRLSSHRHTVRFTSSHVVIPRHTITHRPDWNDVRVVRAILSLLNAALRDDKTTHVLLCTESCVPVATLVETARCVLGGVGAVGR
jgi:hypothetical protein